MMPVHSPREVRLMFGITILIRSVSIIVQTIAPIIFISVFRLPSVMAGWLIAGFWIANAIGSIVSIIVVKNRTRSTLIGLVVISVSFIGLALFGKPVTMTAFIISEGVGLAMVQTFLVPSMYFNKREGRPHSGIGIYSAALSLGMTVGPLIASVAILFYGFSILFVILAAVSIGIFFFALRIQFQKSFEGEDTSKSLSLPRIISTIRQKGFASYYSLNFLYSMLPPIFLSYGGIYSKIKFGISTPEIMASYTIVFTISTMIRLMFSNIQVKNFRILLILSFSILSASFILIGVANNFQLFLTGFLLFSIPHALIYPSTTFKGLEAGGDKSIISSTVVLTTSSGFAEFISPLLAIPVITLYNLSAIFLIMSIFAFIAVVFSFALPMITKSGDVPTAMHDN